MEVVNGLRGRAKTHVVARYRPGNYRAGREALGKFSVFWNRQVAPLRNEEIAGTDF
jgi:hypothetical protein